MAKAAEIQVDGMREVRKALRDMSDDTGYRQPLKEAYGAVGSLVEGGARSLAGQPRPTLGGSVASMGTKAIGSITGKGTTTGASLVAFKGIPWGPGWNFGSTGGRRQFPAKATPDYSLYTAVAENREQITNEFAEAVGDALEQAFPE